MVVCSCINTCAKTVLHLGGHFQKQMRSYICEITSPASSSSGSFIFKQGNSISRYSCISVPRTSLCFSNCGFRGFQRIQYCVKTGCCPSVTIRSSVSPRGSRETSIDFSSRYLSASVDFFVPKRVLVSDFKCCNFRSFSQPKGSITAGLISGLLVCCTTSDSVHAEAREEKGDKEDHADLSSVQFARGKRVHTDYSVIGIPGDGRCLFRSVAHGACLRSGKPAPSERLQKDLADELRASVADEFIRRREETEWFIEGDFDTYVSHMRKPHVWGGESELLMLSHVLRMPITVYMHDNQYGGLVSIAEYGQEYGTDNPIRVLYHGYGHYDALLIPGNKGAKSRL
ncbi:hypothetical protein Cgig2_031898 [Carnegiea gigantea]|uniref:Ubiquitin thioesterase OTU n=1 Tax=Carnegiea gigantea TaxID=171969 RepID=A0A9Q1KR68_9CARY|nr:hypothetical protein Cgig2_031898 [Carnegiea gigantea]